MGSSLVGRFVVGVLSALLVCAPCGNLFALAPASEFMPSEVSFFSGRDGQATHDVVQFIGNALGISPASVQQAIEQEEISPRHLRPLLYELQYLVACHILTQEQLRQFRGQSLRRTIRVLLVLAWQAEFSKPWRITLLEPLRLQENWDAVDLKVLLRTSTEPPAVLVSMLHSCLQIISFGQETFFSHHLFDSVPQGVKERIKNLVSRQVEWNSLAATQTLAIIFFNPFFCASVASLIEQYSGIRGISGIVSNIRDLHPQKLSQDPDWYRNIGFIYELTHLGPSFLSHNYTIVELDAQVIHKNRPYTEVDVLAIQGGKIYLGEIKSINLERYYRLYSDTPTISDPHAQFAFKEKMRESFSLRNEEVARLDPGKPVAQLIREAWLMGELEMKVTLLYQAYKKGMLEDLFARVPTHDFGGIVFSIATHKDPELETLIQNRIRELSQLHSIPIQVTFVGKQGFLTVPRRTMQLGETHPRAASYAFSPPKHAILLEVLAQRHKRAHLEMFQKQIHNQTSARIGIETLRTLLDQANQDRGGLLAMIGAYGLPKILEWSEKSPLQIAANMRKKEGTPAGPVAGSPALPEEGGIALEASGLGSNPTDLVNQTATSIPPDKITKLNWGKWKQFLAFPSTLPDRTLYEKSEPEMWQIVGEDLWLVPEDAWPQSILGPVAHLPDGKIFFNDSFLKTLSATDLGEIAIMEEVLLAMFRRSNGSPQATQLAHDFQLYFAVQRGQLAQRARDFRENLALRESSREDLASAGGRIQAAGGLAPGEALEEDDTNFYRENLDLLEEAFRKTRDSLDPPTLDHPSTKVLMARIETNIAENRDRLNGTYPAPGRREIRSAQASIRANIRSLKRIPSEIAPPAPPVPLPSVELPRVPQETAPPLPAQSLAPLFNLEERGQLNVLLRILRTEMEQLNERFQTTGWTDPSFAVAQPVFDLSLLDRFQKDPSSELARALFSSIDKGLERGLEGMRHQITIALDRAFERGYPRTEQGAADVNRAGLLMEQRVQDAGKKTRSVMKRMINESIAIRSRWPGMNKLKKQTDAMVQKWDESADPGMQFLTVLVYPHLIAGIWGLDRTAICSLPTMTPQHVPVFAPLVKAAGELKAIAKPKADFAPLYWRWTREGFNEEERTRLRKWTGEAQKLLEDFRQQKSPFVTELMQKGDWQLVARTCNFLQSLPNQPYSLQLAIELQKYSLSLADIAARLTNSYSRMTGPLIKALSQKDVDADTTIGETALPPFQELTRSIGGYTVTRRPMESTTLDEEKVCVLVNQRLRELHSVPIEKLQEDYSQYQNAPSVSSAIANRPVRSILDELAICFLLWGVEKASTIVESKRPKLRTTPPYAQQTLQAVIKIVALQHFFLGGISMESRSTREILFDEDIPSDVRCDHSL